MLKVYEYKNSLRKQFGSLPSNWRNLYDMYVKGEQEIEMNEAKKSPLKSVGLGVCTGMQASVMIIDDVIPAKTPSAFNWKYPLPAECCAKKEENMNTYNETEATRKYLDRRIHDISCSHDSTLTKQFRLNNSDQPRTYKELIDAIKNGEYTIDTKRATQVDAAVDDSGYWFGSIFDGIKWNLKDSPDYDGYSVAEKSLKTARTAAKDIIFTGDSAAGLKAVQDFEAWTYTAPVATA